MSSMRDIKQRIGNVSTAGQIIKAMDMVASTKLIKARKQLEGTRPIYHELKRVIEKLGCQPEAKKHVFYQEREVKKTLYLVVTSDKGLSGSYNANISAHALDHMNQGKKNESIVVVGTKGRDYFRKKNKNIVRTVVDIPFSDVYYATEKIAKLVAEHYLAGEADEIFIAYTHFETVLNYAPVIEKLLPVVWDVTDEDEVCERKYEPNTQMFIDHVIPLYLHMNLFRAFSESHTSEQAARMVNMSSASKNADEIIEDLTRAYNRKRQANITQELSEIVGSANVLNKGDLDE